MDQAKLVSWIETLHNEIKEMREVQFIFNEVRAMIIGNYTINVPNPFYGFLRVMYADAISIAIRRQVDADRRSVSVLRLLQEVKGSEIDTNAFTIDNEISHLRSHTELIREYANERIAHISSRHEATLPTWDNVDVAIEIIDILFKRYSRLVTSVEYDTKPNLSADWKDIFRQPWIGDNLIHVQRRH